MSVAFRIAAPDDLAKHLLTVPELVSVASPAGISAEEKGRLDFDLQTAAAVITIVVALADLAAYALKIAIALQDWRKRTRRDTRVVLQGPTRDRVVTVDASSTVEVLAKDIEIVAHD